MLIFLRLENDKYNFLKVICKWLSLRLKVSRVKKRGVSCGKV